MATRWISIGERGIGRGVRSVAERLERLASAAGAGPVQDGLEWRDFLRRALTATLVLRGEPRFHMRQSPNCLVMNRLAESSIGRHAECHAGSMSGASGRAGVTRCVS